MTQLAITPRARVEQAPWRWLLGLVVQITERWAVVVAVVVVAVVVAVVVVVVVVVVIVIVIVVEVALVSIAGQWWQEAWA